MGLKHPHDDGASGRPTFADLGMEPYDDVLFTVMSYENTGEFVDTSQGGFVPFTPMLYDVPALQYLYGAPTDNVHSGDSIHEISYDYIDYVMNYDPTGIDTISGANSSAGLVISLNEISINDTFLSFSLNADEVEPPYSRADGFIGVIENATGSDYADFIYDGILNTIGSVINAGGGDDYITHSGGNDIIDGGDGSDTLAIKFLLFGYSFNQSCPIKAMSFIFRPSS